MITYQGEENQYIIRQDTDNDWWVEVQTIHFKQSWVFNTVEEATAFVWGYELGTGAYTLPRLCEE